MEKMHFTFADTIAGYVTSSDGDKGTVGLKTTDGREFQVKLTPSTYAELLRNLGEPFQDPGAPIQSLLTPNRYLFAHGIFYPEGSETRFEAKHIVFVGRGGSEYRFEEP